MRLTPIGREVGLVDDDRWSIFEIKKIKSIAYTLWRASDLQKPAIFLCFNKIAQQNTVPIQNTREENES